MYHFVKRRREMNQFLSSNSMITFSRYFRLMALASMDAFLTVPLGIFAIVINVRQGVQPWAGLADAHWGFERIDQIPALLWRLHEWFEDRNLQFQSMDDMFTKRSSDESQEGSPADQHDEADRKRYWNIFLASLARSLASDTDGRLKVVRG